MLFIIIKRTLLIFFLVIPILAFGFWKKHKTYTPNLGSDSVNAVNPDATDSDDTENKAGSDPLDSESKPVDTDGDGNPDATDSDDDNDGFADDTENKAGSDPLDSESKPNREKLELHKRIEEEISSEMRKLGCNYVYNKYITERQVPKSYTAEHNWNNWSNFNIKEFENLIWGCKKEK
jgi:hypothetical protein